MCREIDEGEGMFVIFLFCIRGQYGSRLPLFKSSSRRDLGNLRVVLFQEHGGGSFMNRTRGDMHSAGHIEPAGGAAAVPGPLLPRVVACTSCATARKERYSPQNRLDPILHLETGLSPFL